MVEVPSRTSLVVVLVVWVLSFSRAGNSLGDARGSMRQHLPALIRASQQHRLLVSRYGPTFAWWQPVRHGWLLQEICSYPRGRGHGTRLLQEFLRLADEADIPVVLVCPPERMGWYRRHGFWLQPPEASITCLGLVAMHRPRRQPRRHGQRWAAAGSRQWQGPRGSC
ncbi:hypothetical protein acdb102_28720 [Acidothermaceae bacterium B102]|nr:hypothetical protein acdb102_28720 [Acidothermaceae bacterium B102]